MNTDVMKDYDAMLNLADKYSDDAEFVNNLVGEFNSTSETFLMSINDVLTTIEEVTRAANRGAEGTTNIAGRVSEVNNKSNEVLKEALKLKKR